MAKTLKPAPTTQDFDREFRAQVAQMTAGLAPTAFSTAWADWAMHLALSPAKQRELQRHAMVRASDTWMFALRALAGAPVSPAEGFDWRRRSALRCRGLVAVPVQRLRTRLPEQRWRLMKEAVRDVSGVTDYHGQLLEFAVRMLLDATSPSNYLASNPELLALTQAEQGQNLVRGFKHVVEDLGRTLKGSAPAGTEEFEVGKNVAVTPGKVVFRNELIELIQYEPATQGVHAEPVLIVPAWIMKYYILDLSPRNSMVKYLVDQGHTVFMMSWKNPDEKDRDIGMDDYVEKGFRAALDAVSAIVPKRKVHAVGYCIGGTLLAIGAAALARDKDERLASITMFAAQTDFSEPGELAFFINPSQLAMLEATMHRKGVLESKQMGGAFAMLRAQDLLWQPIVNQYLKGQRDRMIDLMAWNADGTRMPWRMHSEYLYRLYLDNELATNRFPVGGKLIRLSDIGVPMFVVGTEADHVAPWKSVYKVDNLVRSDDLTFLLTAGGHNAGIVCRARASQAPLPHAHAPAGRPAPGAGGLDGGGDEARGLLVAGLAAVAGGAFQRQDQAAGDGRAGQGLSRHRGRAGAVRAAALANGRMRLGSGLSTGGRRGAAREQQLLVGLDERVRQLVRVGHRRARRREAEAHRARVAHHGDVQPQAVLDDRQRPVGRSCARRLHTAAPAAPGCSRSRRWPAPASRRRGAIAIELGQAVEYPGHADRREVHRHHAAWPADHGLHGAGRVADGAQALQRVGDVRVQVDERHRRLRREVGVARLAQRDRHGRGQRLPRDAAVARQVAPQRAAAQRQHDVVELGVVRGGQRLQRVQRERQAGKAALGGDRHVQRRRRAEGEVLPQPARRAARLRRAEQAREGAHHVGQVAHELDDLPGVVAQRGGAELDPARVLGGHGVLRTAQRRRPRRDVEQRARQHDAGLPVERRVMGLEVVADLAAFEAVDHVQAPQGRLRSSSSACRRPMQSSNCVIVPGGGSVTRCTWWSRSTASSSTQTGLANCSGIGESLRCSTGARCRRCASCRFTAAWKSRRYRGGSSNRLTDATCIGVSGVSRWRNAASTPLRDFIVLAGSRSDAPASRRPSWPRPACVNPAPSSAPLPCRPPRPASP